LSDYALLGIQHEENLLLQGASRYAAKVSSHNLAESILFVITVQLVAAAAATVSSSIDYECTPSAISRMASAKWTLGP